MAFYITDWPPTLETERHGRTISTVISGGDNFNSETTVLSADDGWTTYAAKSNGIIFQRKQISPKEVVEWVTKSGTTNVHYVLLNIEKLHANDKHAFSSHLVYNIGLGDHEADSSQGRVTMRQGDELILLEWNHTPVWGWFDPDATGQWWWHYKGVQ